MSNEETATNKSNANGTEAIPIRKNSLEASEDDPCMGDTKKRRGEIIRQYRDDICKKTGLTHKGFYYVGAVFVLCLVLFIVIVALAASWPHIPHAYQFPICKTSACLRASAQLNEGLNRSVSPCQDLWGSVCGGWMKNNPLPKDRSIWNGKQQHIRKEAERVRDVIATLKLPLHTGTVEWKLKRLYEACLDVDNARTADEARPLLNIISELGGWYILRDWTDTDLDPNLILHLHVKYGVTPYFKISVDPNPQMPGQRSIRISPSGLGLPNKEYYYTNEEDRRPTAYMDFIKDVIIYLDTAGAEAAKFGRDMFSYEKRIAEITPDLQTLQNPITTYNSYTISELKQTVHNIPFHDILLAMYPESNISENTEVIVSSMDYLTQISHIISSTDKRTMNGYLIWTLVRNYIPFLSDKFIATFDTFQAELLGRQKPLQRWEVCAQLVQNVMGLATEVLLEQSYPLEQTTIKVANNTINSVLNVVKNRIAKFKNTPDLYKQLKLKLNTVRFFIGLPDSVKSDSYLKNYYLKLKIIKTDFFDSVRNGFTFQKKIEERLLMKSSLDESIISFATVPKPEVSYLASDNAIVIPRSLVSKDLFESEFPKAVIYGRLGVEIAKALVSSILPYDGLWTADKKLLSTFHMTVNESLASVKPASRCLSNYILNLNLPVPYNIANETALNALKHISAVSIANEALMQSLNEEHVHQPGLEAFEDSALFFLSFAQTLCGESSNQQQFFDLIERFELPSKTLLLLTWTQLPDFSEAFVCTFNKKLQCSDIL